MYPWLLSMPCFFRPLTCSHSDLGESLAALLWDFSFAWVLFNVSLHIALLSNAMNYASVYNQ
jgi:hypothetical protein